VAADRLNGLLESLDAAAIPYGGSTLRAGVTACSGNTYCKLATIETKVRALSIVEHLEREGLGESPLNIALSACPNTCANHSTADIGLQGCKVKVAGTTVDAFNVFYGGATGHDTAFGEQVFRQIPGDQINGYLAYGVKVFQRRRGSGESFAAFCRRHGATALEAMFQPQVSPRAPLMRWLAERVVRVSGDRWTTYV
jgi:ferredoxin-nitrite reductase